MPTLNQILGNSVTLSIPFENGLPISITYMPGRITQEASVRLQSFADNVNAMNLQEQFNGINAFIVDFLVSWDFVEDDGVTPVPITLERLPKLPVSIIQPIIEAITNDMLPNSQAVPTPKP
jgi:hypothetical protein